MKKVLLTYGFHKSGHYSAVRAIEEELSERSIEYETCNLLAGKSSTIDHLFTIFRSFAEKSVKRVPDFLIDVELLEVLAEELPIEIDLSLYSSIISTHQYSSYVLAVQKQKQNCNPLLIHVHTNYTPFPLRTHPLINYYAGHLPIDDASKELNKKLVATGIPVRKSFQENNTKKEKKILILGGADGFGQIEKIVEFAKKISPDYKLTIICGRNEEVYHNLKKKFPSDEILGYVEDPSEFFNCSEFVITKASGVTVAEALNSGCIPIFPPPILFWEDDAARYLASNGSGICLPDFEDNSVKFINEILKSSEIKAVLKERCKNMARPNSVRDIVDLIHINNPVSIASDQQKMIEEMRKYLDFFTSTNNLPKLSRYLSERIQEWLKKNE